MEFLIVKSIKHVMPLCPFCLFVSDTCTALPSIDNLETTETLPVNYDTALLVGCNTGHTLSGDSSITCERGTVFTYINQPICNIGKYIFFQDFSRFRAHLQGFQHHGFQSKNIEKNNPRRHRCFKKRARSPQNLITRTIYSILVKKYNNFVIIKLLKICWFV